MKISNEVKSRIIEIAVIESVKEHYPSYQVVISLETENIRSCFSNFIWISGEDTQAFILALEKLDMTRKGLAVLKSMSPGEMSLIFRAIDDLGHLSVEFQIKKEDRISMDYAYDVSVSFQVDPTILPSVIKDLKMLEQ
jgi:hypothetical protein